MSTLHYSVMLFQSIDLLDVKPNGIYVDLTLGRGGHSAAILDRLDNGHLYSFDKDQAAIDYCRDRFANDSRITLIRDDYASLSQWLDHYGVSAVDGVLADLGVSSPQFDDPLRGFSYRYDAPLDMRMDQNQPLDGAVVVNTYSVDELTRLFREYGEHPHAFRIAKAIEKARTQKPIETTFELVDIIKKALPAKELNKKGHPAKQIFQALRIEVNNELHGLTTVLNELPDLIKPHGRIVFITFHSLEDRIVNKTFAKWCAIDPMLKRMPIPQEKLPKPSFTLLTKHPLQASSKELDENHRSHSAKCRAVERN